jgi:hypothetical protein
MYSRTRNDFRKKTNPHNLVVPLGDVIRYTAEFTDTPVEFVTDTRKTGDKVSFRRTLLLAIAALCSESFSQTARTLARDHSSILNNFETALRHYSRDRVYAQKIHALLKYITTKHIAPSASLARQRASHKLLTFPEVDAYQLSQRYYMVHKANVGYARALYRAHGDLAKWPEMDPSAHEQQRPDTVYELPAPCVEQPVGV